MADETPVPDEGPAVDRARWDARYARGGAPTEPEAFVVEQAPRLPPSGTALDVAGGAGRHAIWLAGRGLSTLLVDISEVGLRIAGKHAADAGVTLRTLRRDLATEPLPDGPFDVVLIHAYLDRGVLDRVPAVLAPGGLFLFAQPTVAGLSRHDRPSRRFLLEEGEMATIAQQLGLDVVDLTEGWRDNGRHEARLVARRPA